MFLGGIMDNKNNELVIEKELLSNVDVIIRDKEMFRRINTWINGEIKLLGGVINLICDIQGRLVPLDFDIVDMSFMCFDKKDNMIRIKLYSDMEVPNSNRMIIVTSDDGVFCYKFDMDYSYVYLSSNTKETRNSIAYSRKKKRSYQ